MNLDNKSRRLFLVIALGAVVAALVKPFRDWAKPADQQLSRPFELKLVDLLKHRESAKRIGSAYIRITSGEANANKLASQILSDLAYHQQELDKVSPADLRERIRWRTRQDFEDGRVIKLHGWIVSVTEIRICVLSVFVLPGSG